LCTSRKLIGKNLHHLACRHHIQEIIAEITYKSVFGETTGPKVKQFADLKIRWAEID
jgi:hypothetical protein